MSDEQTIRERIQYWRVRNGLSQAQLADDARISLSLVRKIETGERAITQPTLTALARALHVDINELTGQPYDRYGDQPDRVHAAIPELRHVLTYWGLPPALDAPLRPLDQLVQDAERIARLRQRDKNIEVVEQLPPLLTEAVVRLHDDHITEPDRASLVDATVTLLHAAHSVTYKVGYGDLSVIVEYELQRLADLVQHPVLSAFSAWARTTSLMRLGDYDRGLVLMDQARAVLEPLSDDGALRMSGALHLRSAILAARAPRSSADTAYDHMREARRISFRLEVDTPGGWRDLAFGPSNVDIHDVATAVEAGDAQRALDIADRMHLPEATMVKTTPTRLGHHYIDLSRAQLGHGLYRKAEASLLRAFEVAPQQTRHHPMAHEVSDALLRVHNRANPQLAALRNKLGRTLDV